MAAAEPEDIRLAAAHTRRQTAWTESSSWLQSTVCNVLVINVLNYLPTYIIHRDRPVDGSQLTHFKDRTTSCPVHILYCTLLQQGQCLSCFTIFARHLTLLLLLYSSSVFSKLSPPFLLGQYQLHTHRSTASGFTFSDNLASSHFPPPPLTTSSTRSPSVESTAISTPTSHPVPTFTWRHPRAGDDHLFTSRHKSIATDGHSTINGDRLLFLPDDEHDHHVPLLSPSTSPQYRLQGMPSSASPITIAGSRQTSTSPRNHESNLTSQLQQQKHPQLDIREPSVVDGVDDAMEDSERLESVGMLGSTPLGARSIPARNGQRRGSNGMSSSLMGGMSWGGISMGSFIRDEYVRYLLSQNPICSPLTLLTVYSWLVPPHTTSNHPLFIRPRISPRWRPII